MNVMNRNGAKDAAKQAGLPAKVVGQAGRGVAIGAGAATGAGVMYWVFGQMSAEQVEMLTKELGGYFIITMALIYVARDFGKQALEVGREFVAEQARISSAIQAIAEKDDRRVVRHDLLLGYLTRQAKSNSETLAHIKGMLAPRTAGGREAGAE